jgi:Domain of unknown function (DUF4249)
MKALKRVFAFLFLVALASCIDPYYPDLKNYKSLLVVEGLITNENSSYKIKLGRTTSQQYSDPDKVTDANVFITDGDGLRTQLQNSGNGYYNTDSTSFTGMVGQKYTLHILTSDGKEYTSDECTMLPVAGIDTVYYEKGDEVTGTQGEITTGVKIFLNSADATGLNKYFRWTFEETWKFIIPNPVRYKCLMVLDPETYLFEQVPDVQEFCWKNSLSQEIMTNSITSGRTNYINRQQIKFIDPVQSDRLTKQYSIQVKQYSLSEDEFDFWNNLNKAGEAGGDIFSSQPYSVISNIHNVNNAGDKVLGYFEVSSVTRKRIYITAHDLDPLYLPNYQTDCVEYIEPVESPGAPTPSLYETYYHIMTDPEFVFIKPLFNSDNTLHKLVYSKKECCMCEYAGFPKKPEFWIDLE